jgi:hypothetical protein
MFSPQKSEFIVGGISLAISLFCLSLAFSIESVFGSTFEMRMLPVFLSGTMVMISLLIFFKAVNMPRELLVSQEKIQVMRMATGRMFGVIVVGLVYVGLFYAVGYVLATAVSMYLVMIVLGNSNHVNIALTAMSSAIIYQFIFMGMFGFYDPVGRLIDLSAMSEFLS